MNNLEHEPAGISRDFYFAKMLVALELRRTHGIVFAAAFLDQFRPEICRAAASLASRAASEAGCSSSG